MISDNKKEGIERESSLESWLVESICENARCWDRGLLGPVSSADLKTFPARHDGRVNEK